MQVYGHMRKQNVEPVVHICATAFNLVRDAQIVCHQCKPTAFAGFDLGRTGNDVAVMNVYKKMRTKVECAVNFGACYARISGRWHLCGFCFENEVDDAEMITFLDRYYIGDRVLPEKMHNRNAVDFAALSRADMDRCDELHHNMLESRGGQPSMRTSGLWSYPGNSLGSAVSPGMSEFLTLYHDGTDLRTYPVDTPAANEACKRIHAHNVRNGWKFETVRHERSTDISYTYIHRRGAVHIYSPPMARYISRLVPWCATVRA